MPETARPIRGWPWRDIILAIVGLLAGCYVALDLFPRLSGWNLVMWYAVFTALFLVFALLRRHYRTMFLGAFVGLTGTVVYLVLFVTG